MTFELMPKRYIFAHSACQYSFPKSEILGPHSRSFLGKS